MTKRTTDAIGRSDRPLGIPRRGLHSCTGMRTVGSMGVSIFAVVLIGSWHALRLVLGTLLVLLEPLLRMTLVPLAFLSFGVTVVFGFLIGDPRFPKWGMLTFSVGTLWLYGLFVVVTSLIVGRSRGQG